ncbi:MAG: hypothetical protein WAN68_11625 [Pseudolabrys sp.]
MKKRGDSRKFLTVALALGVLANAGGKLAFAKDLHLADAARPAAIHDCNTEAVKYNPITQQSVSSVRCLRIVTASRFETVSPVSID